MSDVSFWECPNCGSNDFAETEQDKYQCTYCGSVMTVRNQGFSASGATKPGFSDVVQCPRCGSNTERGTRYCDNCGQALVNRTPIVRKNWRKTTEPAFISIIVSTLGSFFIPGVGPILGLILGYKALKDARDGGKGQQSENHAKTAIIIGWIFVLFNLIPICLAIGGSSIQWGCSLCQSLYDGQFSALHLN